MVVMKTELRIVKVLGRTKAEGFKELAEGDTIILSVPLYNPGQRGRHGTGGGCLATDVTLLCTNKALAVVRSMAQMTKTLEKFFELEELT